MPDRRPDPEELLRRVREEESRQGRGKLKIFFGAAPGVGKTYAMLEAARARRNEGVEVVVGVVETHGRSETLALLEDLEILPRKNVAYKGTTLPELDIDGALTRRPKLILVDELAHTNAPGSRHAKRWQDVVELLDAGLDVYTTLNVQHIESLNDVVAQITYVIVRETVPDSILERADEVELIDIAPDDLLQRLREGKVYVPDQAARAVESFFKKGNLIALRELALRRTAQQVDVQMQSYRRDQGIDRTWAVAERLLVCVSPSPLSARVVRATARMAAGLHAEWVACFVETPRTARLGELDRQRVVSHLRLAEKLGAKTVTLSGQNIADELLTYARAQNATKIVIGKPTHPRWRDAFRGSLMDDVVRGSGDIDVYVIAGDEEGARVDAAPQARRKPVDPRAYAWAVLAVVIATAIGALMFRRFELANIVMVYLLAVIVVASRLGHGPSIVASILSVAALDFFFIPPYLTFAVSDLRYLLTFGVMLVVGLVVSSLTDRIRNQAESAREREQRTGALYAIARELAAAQGRDKLARAAVRHLSDEFKSEVVLFVSRDPTRLEIVAQTPGVSALDDRERAVARWVVDHKQMAGASTDTLPSARALYLPLVASRGTVGAIGLVPATASRFLDPVQRHLLEMFAGQVAVALERALLADEAQKSQMVAESERLRNTLLSSLSHDLRTPLAAITGAATTLLDNGDRVEPKTRTELLSTIHEEAVRLNRLVGNLLDMTLLESGSLEIEREWQPLEEVVGAVLNRLDDRLKGRKVTTTLHDLPLVHIDGVLIEQVLVNLIENALKYAPPPSPVDISARASGASIILEVADRGPGFPTGEERNVFEKFYRVPSASFEPGMGLGLAICRGIVQAHGGTISAFNRDGGGAVFRFTIPREEPPYGLELSGAEAPA